MEQVAMHALLVARSTISQSAANSKLSWIIADRKQSDWEFFFTIAVAGLVALKRSRSNDHASAQQEYSRLLHELNRWDARAGDTTHDFLEFTEKNAADGVDFHTAIGIWILARTNGEWPSHSRAAIAPGLGNVVIELAHECQTAPESTPETPCASTANAMTPAARSLAIRKLSSQLSYEDAQAISELDDVKSLHLTMGVFVRNCLRHWATCDGDEAEKVWPDILREACKSRLRSTLRSEPASKQIDPSGYDWKSAKCIRKWLYQLHAEMDTTKKAALVYETIEIYDDKVFANFLATDTADPDPNITLKTFGRYQLTDEALILRISWAEGGPMPGLGAPIFLSLSPDDGSFEWGGRRYTQTRFDKPIQVTDLAQLVRPVHDALGKLSVMGSSGIAEPAPLVQLTYEVPLALETQFIEIIRRLLIVADSFGIRNCLSLSVSRDVDIEDDHELIQSRWVLRFLILGEEPDNQLILNQIDALIAELHRLDDGPG